MLNHMSRRVLVSIELFTSNDMKYQRKVSRSLLYTAQYECTLNEYNSAKFMLFSCLNSVLLFSTKLTRNINGGIQFYNFDLCIIKC